MKNSIINGTIAIIFMALLLGFIVAMNVLSNRKQEENCMSAGGQFMRANSAEHSLCVLPKR